MEANFPLFWGSRSTVYANTLISNDSPYDRFMEGDRPSSRPRSSTASIPFLIAAAASTATPARSSPVPR